MGDFETNHDFFPSTFTPVIAMFNVFTHYTIQREHLEINEKIIVEILCFLAGFENRRFVFISL